MAIKLIGNYAKRLGLPGYSSHQFSVSIETELVDTGDIQGEATRIYHLLQDAVDREIQETGFVPGDEYGLRDNGPLPAGTNGNGSHGGNGHRNGKGTHPAPTPWNCSDKQRQLVADLQAELGLTDGELDARSERLFRKPAHGLDKLGASGLISDLLAEAGIRRQRSGNGIHNHNGNGSPRSLPSNGNGSHRRAPAGAHRNGGGA